VIAEATLTDEALSRVLRNVARVDANIATAVIEHEFESGLKIKNASRIADYDKFYQNVFPGGAIRSQLPEPATMTLLVCGVLGLSIRRKRA